MDKAEVFGITFECNLSDFKEAHTIQIKIYNQKKEQKIIERVVIYDGKQLYFNYAGMKIFYEDFL